MTEIKNCQNCKKDFVIEPEDFDFYKKIDVPPPTFCPECRMQRRFSWRNMWHLYKKKDERTGELIFSSIPPESPVKIYDHEYWISDQWNPLDYGRDIDWNRPFLEQFRDLLHEVPIANHSVKNLVGCEYVMNANNCKNCYFTRAAAHTEDSAYVVWDEASKNCMDSHMTDHCEFSYGNVNTIRCYATKFSVNCEDCTDMILSRDCIGCNNCIGSAGLRGKSYYIFNEPHSKEEYAQKLKELNLGSRKAFTEVKAKAREVWLKTPVKFMQGIQNSNVSGDYIYNSKNVKQSYRVMDGEDLKYCQNMLSGPVRDSYDYSNWGQGAELMYDTLVCGEEVYNIKFSWNCWSGSKNIQYSVFCRGAQDSFGCVSVRGQYCILNKQYSKEEYNALVPKLIKHMTDMPYVDKLGRVYKYGEFFPAEMSPFQYNVSEAHEYFPKTREWALSHGLKWRDEEKRNYVATKQAHELPDNIKDATTDILKETIACAHAGSARGGQDCLQECTTAFRIIPRELEFLKQFNIPLPDLCPNCRQYERFALRNLPHFYDRACAKCAKPIVTSYPPRLASGEAGSPDRPEIVYCEACYNKEVV